ncbi:MAG: hypothetical protein BGN85_12470 [Alphaproteobacteria bacterium 64-11]|nr:MAG: hypothetical protein BGN85_12470 [Alphaproteobacteria bacterium 64-11]
MLGLVATLGLGLRAPVQAVEPVPDAAYLKPHRMVAVQGGRRLNLFCLGHGRPTVLFDAGLGGSTLSWRKIQGEVAKTTRACSYDRAGHGFSDPPPGPATAEAAVADIHRLLSAAHVRTPVLYVGHSIAGLYGVLLQALHPEDVAGEVLVDPSFAGQFQAMTADLPKAVRDGAAALYRGQLGHLKACAVTRPPLPKDCLGHGNGPERLPPALAALEESQVSRPSYIAANASEFESFLPGDANSPDQHALQAHPADFGDKPLIVLTHSRMAYPGVTPDQNVLIEKAWMAGHDRLAGLSSRGSNSVVPDSGHFIQLDQPQAVIAAIDKAIVQLRAD